MEKKMENLVELQAFAHSKDVVAFAGGLPTKN